MVKNHPLQDKAQKSLSNVPASKTHSGHGAHSSVNDAANVHHLPSPFDTTLRELLVNALIIHSSVVNLSNLIQHTEKMCELPCVAN